MFISNGWLSATILKNIFWLSTGEMVLRATLFFLMVFAARILGPTDFGIFNFAFASASLFVIFSHFGFSDTLTRELAQENISPRDYLGILSFKVILSIGTLFLILVSSFFIFEDATTRKLIWILGGYTLITNFFTVLYSFFRASERMEYEALLKTIQAFIIAGMGTFILLKAPSPERFGVALLVGALVSCAILVSFFFLVKKVSFTLPTLEVWKRLFILSWPLGVATAFGIFCVYIDSVMMGLWGQITEVGWYNAAYRVVGALIIPAVLVGTSFYPTVSRLFKESREQFMRIVEGEVILMVIVAIPLATGGIVFAHDLITFFYGSGFAPAALAFQLLIVMAAMSYIYIPFYLALIASGKQKTYLWVTGIGALANVLMNIFLIPRFSLYGAAVATLISSFVLLGLVIFFSVRFSLFPPLSGRILRALIASIFSTTLMTGVLFAPPLSDIHVLTRIIVGIFVFGTGVFLFIKGGFLRVPSLSSHSNTSGIL